MNTQFANFDKLQFIDDDEYNTHIKNIVKQCKKSLIILHQEGVCSDKLLYQIAGIKIKDKKYTHLTGSTAKYFCCNTPAYAYPLFKHISFLKISYNVLLFLIYLFAYYNPLDIFLHLELRHFLNLRCNQ